MDKRVRRTFPHSQHKTEMYSEEDRISHLPDHILGSILSWLTIGEAARTSVLSRRWENLWKFITCLNLDGLKAKWEIEMDEKLLKTGRKKYIRWVNRVLNSHKGSNLDEFTVCFDLDQSCSSHVDKWVGVAVSKRVKRLKIDLAPFVGDSTDPSKRYTFPTGCYSFMKSRHGLASIKPLKSLCLKFVSVNGEILEHLLLNCPLLERLSVTAAEQLLNLKVAGSLLQLKHFEIEWCNHLESIEICAPNLVTFSYYGQKISLQVHNLPLLTNLSVGGGHGHCITYAFRPFWSFLSQLETLTLDMYLHKENPMFPRYPELTNLKQLTVKVRALDTYSLFGLSLLIKSSPFLRKFTLHLCWTLPRLEEELKMGIKCPHHCLEVVEMVGFASEKIGVELVMYFLEIAVMLEKIIIDPRHPDWLDNLPEFENTEKRIEKMELARQHAEQLKTYLPSGIELVIL